jgi:hypothetical protein
VVERFCDTHFERFGRREHNLLRVFHKLFGLLGYRLDLVAFVLCRKFQATPSALNEIVAAFMIKVCVTPISPETKRWPMSMPFQRRRHAADGGPYVP